MKILGEGTPTALKSETKNKSLGYLLAATGTVTARDSVSKDISRNSNGRGNSKTRWEKISL